MDMNREKMLSKLKRYQMPIYIIVVICYMLVVFARGTPSIMGPELMKDLNINAAEFGLVGLAYFWVYALAAAIMGGIIDRYGARVTLIVNLVLIAIGSFIFSYASGITMLVFGRIVIAFAASGLFLVGVKSVTVWFTTKQFPTYYSIWMGLGFIGGLLATGPLQALMNSVGWRHAIAIIGLACVVWAIVSFFMMKSSPSDIGLPSPNEIAGIEVPKKDADEGPSLAFGEVVKKILKNPVVWLIYLYMFGMNAGSQVLVTTWGGTFLSHGYGLSKADTSSILTVCAIGLVIGCILAGPINRWLGPAMTMLSGSVVFLAHWVYLLVYLNTVSILELKVIFFLNGFFQMYGMVGAFTALRQNVEANIMATASGFSNTFAWCLGAGLCSQIWGLIINAVAKDIRPYPMEAFQAALWFQLSSFIITIICAIILYRIVKKKSQTQLQSA